MPPAYSNLGEGAPFFESATPVKCTASSISLPSPSPPTFTLTTPASLRLRISSSTLAFGMMLRLSCPPLLTIAPRASANILSAAFLILFVVPLGRYPAASAARMPSAPTNWKRVPPVRANSPYPTRLYSPLDSGDLSPCVSRFDSHSATDRALRSPLSFLYALYASVSSSSFAASLSFTRSAFNASSIAVVYGASFPYA